MITVAVVVSLAAVIVIGWVYFSRSNEYENDRNYIGGEIRIGLKPYTDREILVEFVNRHPEISIASSSIPIDFRADASVSLKPYSELQNRIVSQDDQEIRQLVSTGEDELRAVYETLKTSPLLNDAVLHEAFYSDSFPENNELPYIYFDFKEGTTEGDFNGFLSQFENNPKLEVAESSGETSFYTIQVPEGKEEYWIDEFGKQAFIKTAYPSFLFKLN